MIVVIGEVLIDMFPEYQRIGGAPFNFAFHLKRLGFPVRLVTRVGNDRQGQRIIARLTENGFADRDIQVDPQYATGTVRVDLDAQGIPQFDIRRDAAYDHVDLEGIDLSETQDASMVYFGTLMQRTDGGCRRVQRFLDRCDRRTARFCDINLRPPHVNAVAVHESLVRADILKLNEDELEALQSSFGGPPDSKNAIPWLKETFALRVLAITRGDQGSTVVHEQGTVNHPVVADGPIADTVGAGDGYAAVMAAGYLSGIPWKQTVAIASQFAARICTIPGAVPDADAFYDDYRLLLKGQPHGH